MLRRTVADALESAQLAIDFFARSLGEGDLCQTGPQFLDIVEAVGVFA